MHHDDPSDASSDHGDHDDDVEGNDGGQPERHPFDLEERTAKFGEAVIRLTKRVTRDPGNDRLTGQLVGCGTSVGANYLEASEKVSKKDFRHSIGRCKKEAKESKFFLRMLAAAAPELAEKNSVCSGVKPGNSI